MRGTKRGYTILCNRMITIRQCKHWTNPQQGLSVADLATRGADGLSVVQRKLMNVVSILDQRIERWSNIEPRLLQRLDFLVWPKGDISGLLVNITELWVASVYRHDTLHIAQLSQMTVTVNLASNQLLLYAIAKSNRINFSLFKYAVCQPYHSAHHLPSKHDILHQRWLSVGPAS